MRNAKDIRRAMSAVHDVINWNDITAAELEMIQRLGPMCTFPTDPLALITIGMTTLINNGFTPTEAVILAGALAERVATDPDCVERGRDFISELMKGPVNGD